MVGARPSGRSAAHSSGRAQFLALGVAATLIAGCDRQGPLDWDLRSSNSGLSTAAAARQAAASRPAPDARGVISYPGYQVVIAQRGDTVASVAGRLGVALDELARVNALRPDTPLRGGEVLVVPGRVAETGGSGGGGGAIASSTLEPIAEPTSGEVQTAAAAPAPEPAPAAAAAPKADEPVRHVVRRGDSAWSVARLYGVNVRALAEWNGLGPDYTLRLGQTLLIPPRGTVPSPETPAPGEGSATPEPPAAPKPAEQAAQPAPEPETPDLGADRTAASNARFAMPAEGRIVRPYQKGKNEGIGIGAAAGSPVRAAADGTVAAITRDTDQVPIIVIRHADNMLTVYANVDAITVEKDARVTRGQTIAQVRSGDPAFLHFEVRRGFESLDPMPFLE
jgi:LysM repeat protein